MRMRCISSLFGGAKWLAFTVGGHWWAELVIGVFVWTGVGSGEVESGGGVLC